MLTPTFTLRARAALFVAFVFALAGATARAATETGIIITQVYGGGGNSGALYKNDFIELFNPTSSSITLNGYSIQYGGATTSSNLAVNPLPASVTIGPGQFYLIQGAEGSGGTALLPTPDATIAQNLSGTVGKVALVSSTTAVGSCPTSDPTVVDFVGFGGSTTAVNCSLGSPAPLLTNTTAAVRSNVCAPTSNNATDFTAGTPNPRNSASPALTCNSTTSTPPSITGVSTPTAVYNGSAALLTGTVIPGSNPTSASLAVVADLSTIGGSATQGFYDDGTHGDVTAGDNVFSFSVVPTLNGSFTLPLQVKDSQLRMGTANIALTVNAPPPFATIRTIQATKPSAYAAKTVSTSGIVVSVKSSGFYIEAADADTNPTTPEGILVYTGSATLPSYIAIGANVQVTGVVNNYPTTGLTPGTEIDAPQTFSLINAGNPLPAPIKITAAMDSPTGGVKQFSKYEGMRVAIDSLTTTSGTDASLAENTETNTSNGRFYGVVTGVPRPFREPGIAITDAAYTLPVPAGVPTWDSNPELLYIDSLVTGGPAINVTSNATVTGIVGVMDFSFGSPEIVLDATNRPSVTGLMSATAVPARASTEFNIATFNMERFYNDLSDADNPGSSAVTVTTAAYQRRLAKASLAVRNVLLSPDIVGCEEIENMAVLTDLANKISADAVAAGQEDPKYTPYLFLATDGTAINTGVLVKSTRVNTVKAEQFGLATTFTNAGGSQAVLNDRTPLVLHAGIKRASGPDYPVTFIVVHQRSLINVDDPTSTGATVRLKREAQAEYLAKLVQGYQAAGEHVIVVGDFNSFEFSDGFVDTMGVTTGTPVPATQVVTPPASGLVNPALTDLVTLLPAAQRQSYVEDGSAQVLDHVVVTQDLVALETRLVYAHIDADYPLVYQNDATRPERVSDHDPAVAYFTVPPAPLPGIKLSASSVAFGTQLITTQTVNAFTVTNSGTAPLTFSSIAVTGAGYGESNNCGTSLAAGAFCTVTVSFAPGSTGVLNGSVSIASNVTGSPTAVALTGTGGDFTIAAASPSITVKAGSAATLQLNVSGVSGYTGTVNFGCTGAIAGETCTVNPASVGVTGTAQTVTVTVTTTSEYLAQNHPAQPGGPRHSKQLGEGVAFAAALCWFGRRRLRAYRAAITLCVGLAILAAVSGCSDGYRQLNPNGTPLGTQTLTVTASSGGVTHLTSINVTVQ